MKILTAFVSILSCIIFQFLATNVYAVINPTLEPEETVTLEYSVGCTMMGCAASNPCCNSCSGRWAVSGIKGSSIPIQTFGADFEIVDANKPLPQCKIQNNCDAQNCSIKPVEAKVSTEKTGTGYMLNITDWNFIEHVDAPGQGSFVPGSEGPAVVEGYEGQDSQ